MTNQEEEQQIASALTLPFATKPEKEQVLYVTFWVPNLFSFKLMQFGKPSLILNDLVNQLGTTASGLINISITDDKYSLLAEHHASKSLAFTQTYVAEYLKKSWFKKAKTKLVEVWNETELDYMKRINLIKCTKVNYLIISDNDKATGLAVRNILHNALNEEERDDFD